MTSSSPSPPRRKGIFYELGRTLWLGWYRLIGWKVVGELPAPRKFVIIAAPHTSNWDFPLMMACAFYWRAELKWMGKDSLFRGPFGWIMRGFGGIPVDRSKSNDVVAQMAEKYRAADELMVAIPPEGSRGKVRVWKTGFYHIAHGAGVPLVLAFVDYATKTAGVADFTITPSGDYEADLPAIKAFYATKKGKHPDKYQDASETTAKPE